MLHIMHHYQYRNLRLRSNNSQVLSLTVHLNLAKAYNSPLNSNSLSQQEIKYLSTHNSSSTIPKANQRNISNTNHMVPSNSSNSTTNTLTKISRTFHIRWLSSPSNHRTRGATMWLKTLSGSSIRQMPTSSKTRTRSNACFNFSSLAILTTRKTSASAKSTRTTSMKSFKESRNDSTSLHLRSITCKYQNNYVL